MIPRSTPVGTAVIVDLDGRDFSTTTRTKPNPLPDGNYVVAVHGLGKRWPWFLLERVRLDVSRP